MRGPAGAGWCWVMQLCGLWFLVSAFWFVVCGLWFVVCGFWFLVCDLWFVVCGLWVVVCGLQFAVCSLQFAVCGLWFAVCGLWFMAGGLHRCCNAIRQSLRCSCVYAIGWHDSQQPRDNVCVSVRARDVKSVFVQV